MDSMSVKHTCVSKTIRHKVAKTSNRATINYIYIVATIHIILTHKENTHGVNMLQNKTKQQQVQIKYLIMSQMP